MVAFFCVCVITCWRYTVWWWWRLTHSLVMYPPGGRGCYRMPWESPSVSTCSKQSDSPHLRWLNTLINYYNVESAFFLKGLNYVSLSVRLMLCCLCPAGLHLTTDGPLCLRRFLRIYYTLLNKCMSRRQDVFFFICYSDVYCLCCCVSRLRYPWPFSPQSGESIMVEVAAGPSDSATHEKVSLFTNSTTPLSSQGKWL